MTEKIISFPQRGLLKEIDFDNMRDNETTDIEAIHDQILGNPVFPATALKSYIRTGEFRIDNLSIVSAAVGVIWQFQTASISWNSAFDNTEYDIYPAIELRNVTVNSGTFYGVFPGEITAKSASGITFNYGVLALAPCQIALDLTAVAFGVKRYEE